MSAEGHVFKLSKGLLFWLLLLHGLGLQVLVGLARGHCLLVAVLVVVVQFQGAFGVAFVEGHGHSCVFHVGVVIRTAINVFLVRFNGGPLLLVLLRGLVF